jgi:tetrahydromethanopterin S-methyltransferase subunit G
MMSNEGDAVTDNVENLTHEMLRRVHGKLDEIQTEMRLRFTGVETGLAAIEHRLVAFHLTDVARTDEITDLRRRIERIERRLDLVDSA